MHLIRREPRKCYRYVHLMYRRARSCYKGRSETECISYIAKAHTCRRHLTTCVHQERHILHLHIMIEAFNTWSHTKKQPSSEWTQSPSLPRPAYGHCTERRPQWLLRQRPRNRSACAPFVPSPSGPVRTSQDYVIQRELTRGQAGTRSFSVPSESRCNLKTLLRSPSLL